MEIPDLVRDALGGEEIEAGVNLGDEDTVCLTPTRTLVYRADGLLSDEKVEEYPHTVERLTLKEGRRKTKFTLQYVDGKRTLSVPSNRDTKVLELLFEGILGEADVIAEDESVRGAFRFSELTMIVTDARVVKHIGAAVWTDDFEEYAFENLTGLSFERGSVATEVVLEIDGRPQRIKTPNEQARKVQQVVENAVFDYHGVGSLEELNDSLAVEDDDENEGDSRQSASSDIELGGGIDPLVDPEEGTTGSGGGAAGSQDEGSVYSDEPQSTGAGGQGRAGRANTGQGGSRRGGGQGSAGQQQMGPDEVAAQLDELTTAVQRQNELLEKQHETIKQLIQELREGR